MYITHLENNYREINKLEIEIPKTTSSRYLLNDIITGQNDPIYKLLPSSVIRTPISTAHTKQLKKSSERDDCGKIGNKNK